MPPQTAGRSSNALRIVYCGRLVQEQKRIIETTEALINAAKIPDVNATIFGDGTEREWVKERLTDESNIRYGGQLAPTDLQDQLLSQHVIALLSDYEGLPIALIEGMAAGLVPIGLETTSGINEVIEHGVNGLLVSDREDSFINAIYSLRDSKTWSRLSHAAHQTVQSNYSHQIVFKRWLALCQRDPPKPISPVKIQKKVRIERVEGRFVDYPRCRPSWQEKAGSAIRDSLAKSRQFVRPRARIRQAIGLLYSNPGR